MQHVETLVHGAGTLAAVCIQDTAQLAVASCSGLTSGRQAKQVDNAVCGRICGMVIYWAVSVFIWSHSTLGLLMHWICQGTCRLYQEST